MSDSITSSNGRVVKVGDVVPMMDGRHWYRVEQLLNGNMRLSNNDWYSADGKFSGRARNQTAIDIAKLAEQQATLAPPAPDVTALLRMVVEGWLADAEHMGADQWRGAYNNALRRCAADLARLLPAEKEGGRT